MARVDIKIDVTEIEGIAKDLLRLDQRRINRASVRAVNKVAQATEPKIVSRITKGLNLDDTYVRQRMYVAPAKDDSVAVARAEIIAPGPGSRNRNVSGGAITSLRTYDAKQLTQPVKWPNSRIADRVGKLGPNPRKPGSFVKWTKRTGDQMRGIAPDMKGAGVSVEVTRGQRKKISKTNVFLLPMKRGRALDLSRLGVFVREKGDPKKKVRLLLGPSVYQLLNRIAPEIGRDVLADLRAAGVAEVGREINEALSP